MKPTQTAPPLAFEVASGSVLGAVHAAKRTNNQDCLAARTLADGTLVLGVADGCSMSKGSEFGARLGVQSVVSAIARLGTAVLDQPGYWEWVKESVLSDLAAVMRLFAGSPAEIIREHLLFTLIGAIITPETTILFHFGDGTFIVNGERIVLPTMQQNQPAYCAYSLVPGCILPPEHMRFQVARTLPTHALKTLLVGTDGLNQLPALAHSHFPARAEVIGEVSQFWLNDAFFTNPLALSRFLTRLNPLPAPWREGLLKDDTTFFVVRHRNHLVP